jgi:hypothetical protein
LRKTRRVFKTINNNKRSRADKRRSKMVMERREWAFISKKNNFSDGHT